MLSRRDQENLTARHHQLAASKPLNQLASQRALAPKTPGRKVPLNDENGASNNGGVPGKALKSKAAGSQASTAFITPAAQRARAPLGLKTTNAKARALASPLAHPTAEKPAPDQSRDRQQRSARFPRTLRRTSARLAILADAAQKPLYGLKPILAAGPTETEELEEGYESDWSIEHCPPPPIPLLDEPTDVFPPDFDYTALTEGMMTDEMAEEVLRGLDEEIEREERDGEGGGWDLEGFLRRLEGGGVGGGGVKGEEGAKGGRLGVGSRLMQPTRASAAKAVPASAPATATALGQERRRPGSAKGSVGRTGLKGGVIGGFPRKAHGSASGVRSGVVGRRPVSSSSGGKLDVLRDA